MKAQTHKETRGTAPAPTPAHARTTPARPQHLAAHFAAVLALVCALALSLAAPPAWARTTVNTSASVNASVSFSYEGTLLPGATFSLYKVADMNENAEFTLTDTFRNSGVTLRKDLTVDEWSTIAQTLSAYVTSANASGSPIAAAATATTGTGGTASFQTLGVGLYLMVGTSTELDGYVYTPLPTMVTLPVLTSNNTWDYVPTLEPKKERDPSQTGKVSVSAVKVWDDDGHESDRPEEVTLALLRTDTASSSELVETCEVTKSDSWRHEWTGLDGSYTYTVVEQSVPSGYSMTLEQENGVFVVTNSYTGTSGGSSSSGGTTSKSRLPQTGQAALAVTLLVMGGLLLLVFGLIARRRRNSEEHG